MFNVRKIGMALGGLASLAILVYGCGSGGGGGDAPAGTAAQSASAASKAFVNALGVATDGPGGGGAGEGGTGVAQSLKRKAVSNLSDEAQIRLALQDFKSSVTLRQQKMLRATEDSGVQPCPGGGTFRVRINDNNTPNDESDDAVTADFAHCSESSEGSSSFLNGSIRLTVTNGGQGFTMTLNRFTSRTTDSSGSFETGGSGTISFSGSEVACGDSSFLENATFTMNLTGKNKVDLDNDGTIESNESFSLNNLIITLAEAHRPAPDCTPGPVTFMINGKANFTNHLNRADNITAAFTHFAMVVTPMIREIEGVEKDGDTLSLDGTIAISSDCVNGTFTFSTPVGEEPFIPLDASCPVDGRFLIHRGGATTAVIYTDGGGVQIDEGDDGSAEQTFENCEAAEACT